MQREGERTHYYRPPLWRSPLDQPGTVVAIAQRPAQPAGWPWRTPRLAGIEQENIR
jgi:hypothetical protein